MSRWIMEGAPTLQTHCRESMIATVGSGLQPAAAIRHCRRSSSCMFSVAPCSFHPGDVVVDGAPVCEVRGRRPPLDPLLDRVAIASTMPRRQYSAGLPPLPMRPGRDRECGLGDSPFGVGHVRGVPGHPGTTADPAGAAPARHERRTLGIRGFRWFVDLHKPRSWNPRSPVPRERHAPQRLHKPYGLLPGDQPPEPDTAQEHFQTGLSASIHLRVDAPE